MRDRSDAPQPIFGEAALLAPVLLLIMLTLSSYGHAVAVHLSLRNLAAETARAAAAREADGQRERLARAHVARRLGAHSMLDPARLTIRTGRVGAPARFEIALVYDFSDSLFHRLGSLIGLHTPLLEGRVVVESGTRPMAVAGRLSSSAGP
jgi:hypothetical protein